MEISRGTHIFNCIPILYYVKQLRRCGVALENQLMFYKSAIVPITEYACPAWHISLTKHGTETLENIQKRAMSVVISLRGTVQLMCEMKTKVNTQKMHTVKKIHLIIKD